MEKQTPLYSYAGFKVWPNRVEYTVGWWVFKNTTTLPIKKISSVEVGGMTNKLVITMDDGKKHAYHVMNAHKAREVIVSLM